MQEEESDEDKEQTRSCSGGCGGVLVKSCEFWICHNSLSPSAHVESIMRCAAVQDSGSWVNFKCSELLGRGSPCQVVEISAAAGGWMAAAAAAAAH